MSRTSSSAGEIARAHDGRVRLVVNADDFGLSARTNAGIVEACRRGLVTSVSLMVRMPAAAEAVALAGEFPRLSLGLHIDLGEWAYSESGWQTLYEVVPGNDATAVGEEVERQLQAFRGLAGRDPTHVDSHQHVHQQEPTRSIVVELGHRLGVPVRHFAPAVRYCGAFYGQGRHGEPLPEAISPETLASLLAGLSAGITELACHPGYDQDLPTMYCRQRAAEVASLCSVEARQAVEARGIELISFADLRA